ncbi:MULTISPECIES: helix-turn-helix domain-containing protein [unclassified Halanaerobium]|uniref:helix-turn-helix domain-containing protein n=1 Tax=unclassified Halanaerobium TaxID=2641197 RepID=UPI000DF2C859|nr:MULTISPECIES: helix-turn-helix transcriptional regulator [unclassified Halanaerobium]RCW43774.1 helix-turn-helix protein [Halanaerobium sp. MA284_MarDTE_T2]RCW80198.1 helix-turn-helix protein [Halanaerobium sp. DL-01]
MSEKKLGERIKKMRYNLNLTQEKLGEKADLHYTYIGQVERGEKIPSFKALQKIADALNIGIEFLVRENENLTVTESIKIKDINELLVNRNERELELIYDFLQDLIDILDYAKIEKND